MAKLGAALAGTVIMLVILNYAFLAGGYFTGHQRMYMFDALLGWRVLPNLEAARTPYITYTDIHGFRILPNEPRDVRTFDVMLVGDSFCFGSWYSAEQTLAGLLKLNHPALRIANTAVPGYGTDQELLALQRYAPMLKPAGAVVLLTYTNDFDDIRDRWEEVREKPWFTMDGDGLVLERPDSWFNRLLWSAHIFSVSAYLTSLAFGLQPRIYGDDAYAARLYAALLEQMAAVVRARHARFIVLYTSGRNARTPEGRRWAAVVRDAAARAGATFFSLDDQNPLGPAMFAPDEIHWNAAGNRAVYDYIAPRLEPLLQGNTAAASTAR
ncbi:MAG TPA: GDSL-type esterase/lipase family protein [Candidatus Binataceae bacterium]|nr:GDSL-type esterase/lipase family protein [Candidatus Binataceae bacterium]